MEGVKCTNLRNEASRLEGKYMTESTGSTHQMHLPQGELHGVAPGLVVSPK